jgi:hypothetical protein
MENQEDIEKRNKEMIEEAKNEELARGAEFDAMTRSTGWSFVKAYVENKIKLFATTALLGEGFKTLEQYQFERGKVAGLRELLGSVEGAIQALKDEQLKGSSAK